MRVGPLLQPQVQSCPLRPPHGVRAPYGRLVIWVWPPPRGPTRPGTVPQGGHGLTEGPMATKGPPAGCTVVWGLVTACADAVPNTR